MERPQISVNYEDVFPTRIWISQLKFEDAEYKKMYARIEQIKADQTEARGRSNRLGWNSHPVLFEFPEFEKLRRLVISVLGLVFDECGGRGTKYKLVAWANLLYHHGFNTSHVHPGSLLSACFYHTVPDNSAPIVFRDPRPGIILGPLRDGKVNSYSEKRLRPQRGQLVVFPSWLEHRVEVHESEQTRVSIAINADPAH